MAVKHICDRCKKEMKEPKFFAMRKFVCCHYQPLFKAYDTEIEFCKECYDDFWKFYSGAELVK